MGCVFGIIQHENNNSTLKYNLTRTLQKRPAYKMLLVCPKSLKITFLPCVFNHNPLNEYLGGIDSMSVQEEIYLVMEIACL